MANRQTPRRIIHKDHNHSSDKWSTTRCRQSILAGNGPLDEGVLPPLSAKDRALLGEAAASVALDKGDGQTHSLPGRVTVGPPIERPAALLRFSTIAELDTFVADLDHVLDQFATTKSVLVRFEKDGQDLAVMWNGDEWAVEVR